MYLSEHDIAQMIDLSAVRADDDETTIRALVDVAHQYHCHLVTVLPSQTLFVRGLLDEIEAVDPPLLIGGNVGFPSGGQTPGIKAAEARELVQLGCTEIDMVINIGWLLSGRDREAYEDILGVVEATRDNTERAVVKVILECHYLNSNQIRRGCDLCIQAGADFVKTSTGWPPSGASLANIALIKAHVGDAIGIKASGGIRTRQSLMEMVRLGARRFGIGVRWVEAILASP